MSRCPTPKAAKSFTLGFIQQEEHGGPALEDAVSHHHQESLENDIFWLFIHVIDASQSRYYIWHTYVIPNTHNHAD